MEKFILGYPNDNVDVTLDGKNLVQYTSKKEADFESEEWCEVEADTLDEAKLKYEETFKAWKEANEKHIN